MNKNENLIMLPAREKNISLEANYHKAFFLIWGGGPQAFFFLILL